MDSNNKGIICRAAIYFKNDLVCLLQLKNKEIEGQKEAEWQKEIKWQKPSTDSRLKIINQDGKYFLECQEERIMEFIVEGDKIKHERSFRSDWVFKIIDQGAYANLWAGMVEKHGLVIDM